MELPYLISLPLQIPRLSRIDEKRNEIMLTRLPGYINYIFNVVMGWTPEETAVYAKHLRKELNDPNIHAYFKARTVYGRKPHPDEVSKSN